MGAGSTVRTRGMGGQWTGTAAPAVPRASCAPNIVAPASVGVLTDRNALAVPVVVASRGPPTAMP